MGKLLAKKVRAENESESDAPIVVALKLSSLTAAVALACNLRGFVQPFITQPVYIESYKVPIGVVDQSSNFVYNPKLSSSEIFDIENNYGGFIENEKLKALMEINRLMSVYGEVDYDFKNREVILFADVLQSVLELDAAVKVFNEAIAKELVIAVGNITTSASDYLRENVKDEFYFLHSIKDVFDDDHYFDNPAKYTVQQLNEIILNIKKYWV